MSPIIPQSDIISTIRIDMIVDMSQHTTFYNILYLAASKRTCGHSDTIDLRISILSHIVLYVVYAVKRKYTHSVYAMPITEDGEAVPFK